LLPPIDLKLSANPMQWTDDEVLRAMALYGDDLPGNLVVGEGAFERLHTLGSAGQVESSDDYPLLADHAMQGSCPLVGGG
jgi:hypothetical protein